jgi:DNA-binding transcriptional regulator YhcF (GntR family)
VVSGSIAAVRWPLQPLLDRTRMSARKLAAELGLDPALVIRAGRHGLSDVQADHWAIGLGSHPVLVWGWDWAELGGQASGAAHVRLAALLRDQIARGDLRAGDTIPSVGALAARWGVGTKTAALAVAELRADGLVVGGGRKGCRSTVAPTIGRGPACCAACGASIEFGAEHYPHRPHCMLSAHGWCDCDTATHPECCPSCAAGAS